MDQLRPGIVDGADRHDQRIDHDVLARNAEVGGALDDLLGDREAHVGILGYAGLVVGDGDDRRAVLLHERQNLLQPLLLAGDRVDQRLALVDGEPRLQRGDDGGVDRERHVHRVLHQLDAFGQDRRLVDQRDAGIDVEHLRAGLDLRHRIGDDAAVIAARHLLRQQLAPGRVDALADHDEALVETDHDLLLFRSDYSLGHAILLGTGGLAIETWGRVPFGRVCQSRL